MHTKDFFVDNGGDGEAVEAIGESFPEFDAITSLTFIIKTIDTVNRSTLMISAKNKKIIRIFDFVRKKKTDGLKTVLSTIDIVTQKKIVGLRREVSRVEETEKVSILTMDIT